MSRKTVAIAVAALLALPSVVSAQFYVYGSFCSTCSTPSSVNRLYDDGLHGDGAAGDGVSGADIVVDRPAGRYGWFSGIPEYGLSQPRPYCWCTTGQNYAALWTSGPGDVIHFRLDFNTRTAGWQGDGVACDHGTPGGSQFEVVFPTSYWYLNPAPGYPAQRNGTIWSRVVTIPTTGSHQFMFRTTGEAAVFTIAYNAQCGGSCFPGEQPLASFTTTLPGSDVRFQFDELTGYMRALVLGPTPANRTTWGSVKTLYR